MINYWIPFHYLFACTVCLFFVVDQKNLLSLLLIITQQGLDALGLATLDSLASTTTPFSGSRPFTSLTEEDMTNLRTFYRLISLFSGMRKDENVSTVRNSLSFRFLKCKFKCCFAILFIFNVCAPNLQQVKAVSKYGEALTPLDEASLVMYQLPSAQEMLPILSILPEVSFA